MSELRKDPIIGRWVILASERMQRPSDYQTAPQPSRPVPEQCPFCPGHEDVTPRAIVTVANRRSNDPPWSIRVVPNKYPALRIEGDLGAEGVGIYDRLNGIGAHEVIIESPEHVRSTTDLSVDQLAAVLSVYRQRLLDLRRDTRFEYGLVFKNVGDRAGASLDHAHSQLIVTPIVPLRVQSEMRGAMSFYEYRGRCIFCDLARQEIRAGDRVVMAEENFLSFEPFAPRFPFETWILPLQHAAHFEDTDDKRLGQLAAILHETMRRIEAALKKPAYNYLIHTSPFHAGDLRHYHWHIEIIPRITRVAGFEWGTGFYINPVMPESAARFLREVRLETTP